MNVQAKTIFSQSAMYSVGVLLIFSGLSPVVVWAFAGGSWQGDLTWRKPTLYGISAGVTMIVPLKNRWRRRSSLQGAGIVMERSNRAERRLDAKTIFE